MPKSTINSEATAINSTSTVSSNWPAYFLTTPKINVLHQVVVGYLANARQSNAHTKTRGEISGGGRKPWKQKGTGRARAGSSRSPLWIGGGITFGPRSDANHSKKLPVKLRRLALSMALSTKVNDQKLILVPDLKLTAPKTKLAVALLSKLAPSAKSLLLVVDKMDLTLRQAVQNLPSTAITQAKDLNAHDVLNFDTIIITEPAVQLVDQLFGQKAKGL